MPYSIHWLRRRHLFIVRHFGDVEDSEFESVCRDIEDKAAEFEILPRILIEVRLATSFPSSDSFHAWLRDRKMPTPRATRVATVACGELEDTMRFVVSVLSQSGIESRLFSTQSEAISWVLDGDTVGIEDAEVMH